MKTVRVHQSDKTSVEYPAVRRVVELASGQVRLELGEDESGQVMRDVLLPAGTAYDVVSQGVYETTRV